MENIITADMKIYQIVKEHPQLMDVLIQQSPKFEKLKNKLLFNTMAKMASVKDAAKIGEIEVNELLLTLNRAIGSEAGFREMTDNSGENNHSPDHTSMADHHWLRNKHQFEVLDARSLGADVFSKVMEMSDQTPMGQGFCIVQKFEPVPLYTVLENKGFEHVTEKISEDEYRVYFYKTETKKVQTREERKKAEQNDKVPVVIQSATPVVYPLILKMMQSERLKQLIEIEELKIWEETEKHLGWITSGKADISFSAIVASSKLYTQGQDIKLLSVDVWDNFYLLTRGYKADSFSDLKDRTLNLPLFTGAPPYAVTTYLMKAQGLNPEDFNFAFGKPFGRTQELKDKFIAGEIDTVLLREPEASFALAKAEDAVVSLNYGDLWRKLHPKLEKLPNAGLVIKGDFYREHLNIVEIFLKELEIAVKWVTENPEQAAELSFKEMGVSIEEAKLFCERVTFDHQLSTDVKEAVREYIEILKEEGVIKVKKELDDHFFSN